MTTTPEPPRDWNQRYRAGETPWDSGKPSKELARLLAEFEIAPCRTLEIGCGTGTNAIFLTQQGFEVTAVDIAPLAIEQARSKAAAAGVTIDFAVVDLVSPPQRLIEAGPFELVFDRGVYHAVRRTDLAGFLQTLEQVTAAGSLYLVLAGNANDPCVEEEGPPRVSAEELCRELGELFALVQLREFHFDEVVIEGQQRDFLGWSAVWRRR